MPRLSLRLAGTSALVLGLTGVGLGACSSEEERDRLSKLATSCVLPSDCSSPLVCAFGRCHEQCAESRDCPSGQRCVKSADGPGVCLLQDEDRCSASVCPSPLVCGVDGQCRNACQSAQACLALMVCTQSTCAEPSELVDGGLPPADGGLGGGGSGGSGGGGTGGTGGGTGGTGGTGGGGGVTSSCKPGVPEALFTNDKHMLRAGALTSTHLALLRWGSGAALKQVDLVLIDKSTKTSTTWTPPAPAAEASGLASAGSAVLFGHMGSTTWDLESTTAGLVYSDKLPKPEVLRAGGGTLAWADSKRVDAGALTPSTPTAPTTTLAAGTSLRLLDVDDAGAVFWVNGSTLHQQKLGEPSPKTITGPASVTDVARALPGHLYWVRGSELVHVDLNTKQENVLASGLSASSIAVDGKNVYFDSWVAPKAALFCVPRAGGPAVKLTDTSLRITVAGADSSGVYFFEDSAQTSTQAQRLAQ